MPPITINCAIGDRSLSLTLELDPARPNEHTIIKYLELGQFYEPDVSALMLRVIDKGDVVVDVGANAGFFTALMATLTGPEGRVVSFEPGLNNIGRLRQNIAINKFEHVTVVEQPACAAPGEVSFFINSDDSGGNALWDPAAFPSNVKSAATPLAMTLQATTVDREIERLSLPAPKVIKIDTEGAELDVLRGCRKLLTGRRTPFVIAELHPFGLEKMGASPQALRNFMAGFGYATFALFYDGSMPRFIPLESDIECPHFINLLFTTPEHLARLWPVVLHDPRWNNATPNAS